MSIQNEKKTLEPLLMHYTSFESLLKILKSSQLIFGDPEKWHDKNDSASVRAFCRKKGKDIKARVLCFTLEDAIHHWISYAKEGCCINFYKDVILKNLGKSFLKDNVEYKPLSSDNKEESIKSSYLKELNTDKLPFLKRKAYGCEKEYRAIWFGQESQAEKNAIIKFNIKKAIKSIILAPNLKNREFIGECLKEKYGIEVNLSRVEESKAWISLFDNIAKDSSK